MKVDNIVGLIAGSFVAFGAFIYTAIAVTADERAKRKREKEKKE